MIPFRPWKFEDFPLTLHSKQLLILCRGLHLLRPGGRLVYSTCSMNPIENEVPVVCILGMLCGQHIRVAVHKKHVRPRPASKFGGTLGKDIEEASMRRSLEK